jgi:hypothetical protein
MPSYCELTCKPPFCPYGESVINQEQQGGPLLENGEMTPLENGKFFALIERTDKALTDKKYGCSNHYEYLRQRDEAMVNRTRRLLEEYISKKT